MNSNNKDLDRIYNEVSLEVYIEKSKVKEVIESYYEVIKDSIQEVDFDFNKDNKFPIFQIPYIGKLVVKPFKIKRLNEIFKGDNKVKSKIKFDAED